MGLLSAWRDWQDRRVILRGLRREQGDAEERLKFKVQDELVHAHTAMDRDDPHQAEARWTALRAAYPKAAYESRLTFTLLMRLRRFEEAEEMMLRGVRNHPRDSYFACGLAEIAVARHNYKEAIEHCARLRKRFPGVSQGYVVGASALAAINRLDEAEVLAKQAMKLFPDYIGGSLEYARAAHQRRDWDEALRRWQAVFDQFGYMGAYIGAAQALAELGRHDEADQLLATARTRGPTDSAPLVEAARLAQARGNIPEAVIRWKRLVERLPGFMQGYFAAAEAFEAMGQPTETEAVLTAAVDRFPVDAYPLLELARLFHFKRRDFLSAVEVWATVRQNFPQTEEAYKRGAEALEQVGRGEEANALREEQRQRFSPT